MSTSREVNKARRSHTCRSPCAFEEKKKHEINLASPRTHQIHSSPATATISRRRAMKHVPRVSPYSPASIDFFCGNRPRAALAISKNDECYTYTGRQTDRHIDKLKNGTLYVRRYDEAVFAYRQQTASIASLLPPCLIKNGGNFDVDTSKILYAYSTFQSLQ